MSKLTSGSYFLEAGPGLERIKITGYMNHADRAISFLIQHSERKFAVRIRVDYINFRNLRDDVLRAVIFSIAEAFAAQEECPHKIENGWLDLDSDETSRPWPVREKKSWIEYL